MDLAAVIRDARIASGLSQREVGDRAKCSLQAVWKAEQGHGTVALFTAICDVLDIRLAGLPRGRTIAERVKAKRLKLKWSQEKLAARANVATTAVARLETGNARIATL